MPNIKDPIAWQGWQDTNTDPYGACCVKLAGMIMEYLDTEPAGFDATELVTRADTESGEGITGYMAGAIALIVVQCHERGEEFRRSWNRELQLGTEGDEANETTDGVLNPAILSIG